MYDHIMRNFYEYDNSRRSSRVSVLTSALQESGKVNVQTSCYVVQGVLRPCTDSAPYHEYLTDTLGWTITLRCLNSSRLETALYKWSSNQPHRSQHVFGVLNFKTNNIDRQQAEILTLTLGQTGKFTIKLNLENDTDQAAYQYVDSHQVRETYSTLSA